MNSMNAQASPGQAGKQMEPDGDAIKMFVGQIPRSMEENELRKMFEDFGAVYQLNVLRDKVTGQSKGCCFITFYTRKAALDAQNALHNIKTMPGMQHAIQMKPADSEKRSAEERKLFVGMLSRKANEQDIRHMFSGFGQIEECTVLREQSGESKGCAFITFSSKQSALNAIKAMHHSQTMEGCRHPLVVKFADTQKEKEMKKMQNMNSNILTSLGMLSGALNPQYLALIQQMLGGGHQQMGGMGGGLNAIQLQQILAAAAALHGNPALTATLNALTSMGQATPPTNGQSNCATPTSMPNAGDASNLVNLQQLQGLAALASLSGSSNQGMSGSGCGGGLNQASLAALQQLISMAQQQPQQQQQPGGAHNMSMAGTNSPNTNSVSMGMSPSTTSNGGMTFGGSSAGHNGIGGGGGGASGGHGGSLGGGSGPSNGLATPGGAGQLGQHGNAAAAAAIDTLNQAYTGIQQYAATFPNAFNPPSAATAQVQQHATSPAGKQTEGPDGANLFIYHLPQEFADYDLLQMFSPFGNVVSAKVFIDKQTNLSKCFGFVSYDNSMPAQAAIQAMNGFQIGMKRLKVQLKRPKNDAKPY